PTFCVSPGISATGTCRCRRSRAGCAFATTMLSRRWSRGWVARYRGWRRRSIPSSAPMPATRRPSITMPRTTNAAIYRLFAWLSPGFPIGAFSYSHGLEAEVEAGRVHDRATLERWITATIRHGGGRLDADLLRDAYRGEGSHERGLAYRATAELLLESSA